MNISHNVFIPGNDRWDPRAEYDKRNSYLIADPRLRAKVEEGHIQPIVQGAEGSSMARDAERRQEMVKAQEASSQKSRAAAQPEELIDNSSPRNQWDRFERILQFEEQQQRIFRQRQNQSLDERMQEYAETEAKARLTRERMEASERDKRVAAIIQQEKDRAEQAKIDRQIQLREQEESDRRYHANIVQAKCEVERQKMHRQYLISQITQLPGHKLATQATNADQQRLFERHKDIVSAAIEAVGVQAAFSSQKRPHSEIEDSSEVPQPHVNPPKKTLNAFSKLMSAPQKLTDPPLEFSHWDTHLQQALDNRVRSGHVRSEAEWATIVTETIKTSIQSMILPYTRQRPHVQTKINGLHVLIEVATAIAYAPRGIAADSVRHGSLPRALLSNMLEIAEKMSGSERKAVLEEKAFLCKVKTLRYQSMIPWIGNTWTGLDEVLRLMKDPGPVDFRMIYDQLSSQMKSGRGVSAIATAVRKIIKNDITSYVTPSTCFETKYNAMNAVVDAGVLATKELTGSHRSPMDILGEIATALADVGKMLNGEEVHKIHFEMVQDTDFSLATFLDDFLEFRDEDVASYKIRHNQQSSRDYRFKQRSCVKFHRFVDMKKSEKKRTHGNDGLLAKILLLRWNNNYYDPSWFKCRDALDNLLELLVDSSVALTCDRYLWKVDSVLHNVELSGIMSYGREKPTKEARAAVDRSISCVLTLARRGCMETKFNAFKILAKIGMKMIEWMSPGIWTWKMDAFKDQVSEDALTDAMMMICDSIVKMGGINALSNPEISIVKELDVLRKPVPEAFEGLDGVLDVIRDPTKMGTRDEKRVKSLVTLKDKIVIDLTDD